MIPVVAQAIKNAYHSGKTVPEISTLYGYNEETVEKTLFPRKGDKIQPKVISISSNPNKFPTKKELKQSNPDYEKWAEAGRKAYRTKKANEEKRKREAQQVTTEQVIIPVDKPISKAEKMIKEGMEYIAFGQQLVEQGMKLLKNE